MSGRVVASLVEMNAVDGQLARHAKVGLLRRELLHELLGRREEIDKGNLGGLRGLGERLGVELQALVMLRRIRKLPAQLLMRDRPDEDEARRRLAVVALRRVMLEQELQVLDELLQPRLAREA